MMHQMVEVRAVVRLEMLERVVQRLKQSGVPRLTVTRIHAIGAGVDPASGKLSLEEGSEYQDQALVQFICGGERCAMYTEIIARAACTGRRIHAVGLGTGMALRNSRSQEVRTGRVRHQTVSCALIASVHGAGAQQQR